MVESLVPFEETRVYKDILEKGKQEKQIEIAKKMLKEKAEIQFISKVTDLSLDEIEKIKNEL